MVKSVDCGIVVREFVLQSRYLQSSLNKFPDFFRMGTFIDSAHMKF